MAVKRLRWSKIELGTFPDGRAALQVQSWILTSTVLDNEGNRCDWTPHWKNVEELFLKACDVESANKPDSTWVEGFAKTSNLVFSQFGGIIQEASVIRGRLAKVRRGKLILTDEILDARGNEIIDVEETELATSFEISERFILGWLEREVKCFIVNGFGVRLYFRDQWGNDQYYPELPAEEQELTF